MTSTTKDERTALLARIRHHAEEASRYANAADQASDDDDDGGRRAKVWAAISSAHAAAATAVTCVLSATAAVDALNQHDATREKLEAALAAVTPKGGARDA